MTTMNISARPIIDEESGTVTQKVLSVNKNTGKTEFLNIKLEEAKFNTVSNSAISQIVDNTTVIQTIANNISFSLIVEDISENIASQKLEYSTSNKFASDSLCVYYNGLQIVADITEGQDNSSFSLNNDYLGILEEGDVLIASYVKDV